MKPIRHVLFVLLAGMIGSAWAQGPGRDIKLIISPPRVELKPGQSQKFEVALFDANGHPIRIASVRWAVEPATLGKITDDGFFIAGREPGKGVVVAAIKAEGFNIPLLGRAEVIVGKIPPPPFRVVVKPRDAVVPPGHTQQFEAMVVDPHGQVIRVNRVRWEVHPKKLGSINDTGLFTAGPEIRQGTVVAFVEAAGIALRGEARVTVAPLPTSAIEGQVAEDNSGNAIAGAKIWAERLGPLHWRREAESGANGTYRIEHLLPGFYVVKARASGYLPEYYDNARNYGEATPVQLANDDTVRAIDFSLGKGGTIKGTITSESGDVIAGAHAIAILLVKPNRKHHALSGTDGTYAIENLPTGTYVVRAEAAGYKGEFYDNKTELNQADTIRVTEPETVTDIDFALATTSAISGVVTDSTTQQPIAKARVIIYTLLSTHLRSAKIVETDSMGQYIVSVRKGFYLVAAEARGYNKEFYKDARHRLEATPVQVFEDQHTANIDLDLIPLSSISGKVTDQNTNDPIAGALVLAFPERPAIDPVISPNQLRTPYMARTNDKGEYTIENVRSGRYYVLAEKEGYLHEFWQESPDLQHATKVDVPEGSAVTGIDFTLEQGGAISGTITAANNGNPIKGAVVQVWSESGAAVRRAVTNREGKYRVLGLRSGKYILYAQAKGFKSLYYDGVESRDQATPVEVVAPNETGNIDFKLERIQPGRGSISGTVISDADNNPIPMAFVLAVPIGRGRPQFALTDRTGFYEIKGLKSGAYVVFACAPRFLCEFYDNVRNWRRATPVPVTKGHETSGIDFSLAPVQRGAYSIAGRLLRGNTGLGEDNAVVYAMENDTYVASTIPDENGNFVLTDLPAGEYKLFATGYGGSAYFGGADSSSAAGVAVGNGTNASNISFSVPDMPTAVEETAELPSTFALEPNYPNPFNPETKITYQLPMRSEVSLRIYNTLGQEVRRLVQATQEAGRYEVVWNGRDDQGRQLSTGFYLFRLSAGDFTMTRKMILLR